MIFVNNGFVIIHYNIFIWHKMNHPRANFSVGLALPPSKLGNVWVIPFRWLTLLYFYISCHEQNAGFVIVFIYYGRRSLWKAQF